MSDFFDKNFDVFRAPMYLMAKPAGASCNLDCSYCYYREKIDLYDSKSRIMSDDTLEIFVRDYIRSQSMREVLFTWHGGEPMLLPLSFYKKAVNFQRYYADGRIIDNCIQTNGTLLTDDWCRFLKDNNWLVGLSIDGPRDMHDIYRKDNAGAATFDRVRRAAEMLDKYSVPWNAMSVVNNINAQYPDTFYDFFKEIGCNFIQFAPIVERKIDNSLATADDFSSLAMTPESVTPKQWGNFLCRIFDRWVVEDVGKVFIQIFDATLANYMHEQPGVCILSESCGHAGVIESNGDVYSCDHFVFPQYKLGNIHNASVYELMYGDKQTTFAQRKHSQLPHKCRNCEFLFACHGECPKNRFCLSTDGEIGMNYLCEGYHAFFEHTRPSMMYMREQLIKGQPPSNILNIAKQLI